MATGIRKHLLVCAFVMLSYIFLTDATVTITSDFNSYSNIISKLTSMNDCLTVFRAVWGEIRADDDNYLERVKTFYDNLQKYTNGSINSEAEEAAELIDEVRVVLVIENGRLLAETLNNNSTSIVAAVKDFRTNLFNEYHGDLLDAIFEYAIDAIYLFKNTDRLHADLEAIDTRLSTVDAYKTYINWNLYLYYKFLRRGDINDNYLHNVGRSFHNVQLNNWVNSLPIDTTRKVNAAMATLPKSLNVLYNTATVCLSNMNFPNYYLYFKEPPVSNNWISVQAVVSNANFQHSSWKNSFANQVLTNTSTIRLATSVTSYLLASRSSDTSVVIEKTSSSMANVYWTPIFSEDKIYFEQNGNYMCATATYDNSLSGFLVKIIRLVSFNDPMCQWILTDCSEFK